MQAELQTPVNSPKTAVSGPKTRPGAVLGRPGTVLDPSGTFLGPSLGRLGVPRSRLGAYLEAQRGCFEAFWILVWAFCGHPAASRGLILYVLGHLSRGGHFCTTLRGFLLNLWPPGPGKLLRKGPKRLQNSPKEAKNRPKSAQGTQKRPQDAH